MIKYGCAAFLGVLLGAGAFWFFTSGQYEKAKVSGQSLPASIAKNISESFRVEDIKEELAKTGSIVREKAKKAGASLSDTAANTRITATIKGKMVADRDISSLQISVDTTDGVVTLAGKAGSVEAVAKAVKIAYDVEGVTKVYSTIQVVEERK